MAPRKDPSRSLATQPYRTTRAAQDAARAPRPRTRYADLPEPQPPTHPPNADSIEASKRRHFAAAPPTVTIRVYEADGRPTTLHLHDITSALSAGTLITLAAVKASRQ